MYPWGSGYNSAPWEVIADSCQLLYLFTYWSLSHVFHGQVNINKTLIASEDENPFISVQSALSHGFCVNDQVSYKFTLCNSNKFAMVIVSLALTIRTCLVYIFTWQQVANCNHFRTSQISITIEKAFVKTDDVSIFAASRLKKLACCCIHDYKNIIL